MHDPTEGGVAGALLELATAASVGLAVESPTAYLSCPSAAPSVTRSRSTRKLLGLIASGALLATLPHSEAERLVSALNVRRASLPA